MAGKITDLTALTGANLATGDLFEVVDVSDTTLAATGTNKSMTASELANGLAPKFGATIVIDRNLGSGASVMQQWSNATTVLAQMSTDSSRSTSLFTVHRIVGFGSVGYDLNAGSATCTFAANTILKFASDNFLNSPDVGMKRNAAGVMEINSSTGGTFRDLKLRSLIMTQGSGSVIILPTADPAVSGALWNNGGTIAISA